MQWFISDGIQIFFIGIDWQDFFCVSGFVKLWVCVLFFCQFIRGFQQVILNGFEGFMCQVVGVVVGVVFIVFCQVVSEVDYINIQCMMIYCFMFGGWDWVILIIQQCVKCMNCQNCQFFQFIQVINCVQVESRQCIQCDFIVFVVDVVQWFGWQGYFQVQVRLMYWCDGWIKWVMGIVVVNVLNIDMIGRCMFLYYQ